MDTACRNPSFSVNHSTGFPGDHHITEYRQMRLTTAWMTIADPPPRPTKKRIKTRGTVVFLLSCCCAGSEEEERDHIHTRGEGVGHNNASAHEKSDDLQGGTSGRRSPVPPRRCTCGDPALHTARCGERLLTTFCGFVVYIPYSLVESHGPCAALSHA